MKRTPSPRKKSPGKKASPKVISVDQRDVGTRFTKREVIHTTIDMTGTPVAEFLRSLRPSTMDEQEQAFDRRLSAALEWAEEVHKKSRGSSKKPRERFDSEWYAAQILRIVSYLRKNMERESYWGAVYNGVELGELIAEADALGYIHGVMCKSGGDARGMQVSKDAAPRIAEVLALNAEIKARHLSQRGRAAKIARKLGKPFNTIHDILRKHSKETSTS